MSWNDGEETPNDWRCVDFEERLNLNRLALIDLAQRKSNYELAKIKVSVARDILSELDMKDFEGVQIKLIEMDGLLQSASLFIKSNHDSEEISTNLNPPFSEWFDSLMPMNKAIDFRANIEELFPLWVDRFGERIARRVAKRQMVRAVIGHWAGRALSVGERLVDVVAKVAKLS